MSESYHFIGIGGIGMSGIAQLVLRGGSKVSGSDLKENANIKELKSLGAKVFIGHRPENIKDASLVIYSSAIKEDNPEIAAARKAGIPVIKRAQALAKLMAEKKVITVTGSHGKTTTTSLVSCLLLEAGYRPSVAIGGILKNIDTNALLGEGKYFVAEADESDGSFLCYRPRYSIITNIDREHLDYYKEFTKELDAFAEFLNKTEKEGCVFACDDDANLEKVLAGYSGRRVLFGMKESADIYPKNIIFKGLSSEFDCFYKNEFVERFALSLGGRHNISNALSVIALGLELGIGLEHIKKALGGYKGAKRRLEVKSNGSPVTVIDDYAHHPTEIKATLSALGNLEHGRVIAVFQPHRYTRTEILLDEFCSSFDAADCVIITDIYAASETPIEGVSGRRLCDKIKERVSSKEVTFLPKEEISAHILKIARPGDLVITLGAGDIVKVSDDLVEKFKG